MKKIILTMLAFTGFIVSMNAQKIYKGEINTSSELKQIDEVMYITIDMDMSELKLEKNRYLTITPVLTDKSGVQEIVFSPILINGKKHHKVYKRGLALNKSLDPSGYYAVVKADKKHKELQYVATTAFLPWMKDAQIKMEQDVCGCAGHKQEFYTDYLNPRISLEKVVEPPKPIQIVEIKEHVEEIEAFIEYPINKSTILADFGDNRNRLSKLKSELEEMIHNNEIEISKINIVGYASPEGPTALNQRLSEARAEALKGYLLTNFPNIDTGIIRVTYGGEDWKELEELIAASNYTDKEQILSVIRHTENPEVRKSKLKTLNNGSAHRKMAKEIYPQIRRATFYIHYTVKEKEIREVFETP